MKDKKNLLKEGTVRRFMKLADLTTLSENFFDAPEALEEEETEALEEEEEPMDMGEPEEEPMDMEADEAPAGEENEELARDVASAVASALEDVLGVDVSVEGGEEEAPMDMEADEPPMDLDEPEGEEGMEELEEVDLVDDDAMVAEVTSRVAKRLKEMLKRS
jgi:hypothetical protein